MRAILKYSLGVLLAANGLFMLIAPHPWYEAVPGVTETGPFNPHFVRDIGAAYLAACAGHLARLALPTKTQSDRSQPMMRWFFNRQLNAFQSKWNYDASYAREVLEADPMALVAFMIVSGVLGNRKGAPPAARFAVSLVAVMAEDCGPCSQLGVDMAIAAGVDPKVIRAVAERDYAGMPEDVVLAVRFAEASLDHSPAADEPRDEIVRRWGHKGLVSLAMAMTAARMYPTAKYALGHGKACMRLSFAGETATVSPKLRAAA